MGVRYHKMQEYIAQGHVRLVYEPTSTLISDILTKNLYPTKFKYHSNRLLEGKTLPTGLSPNLEEMCRYISDRTYQYHRYDGCVLHLGNKTEPKIGSVTTGGGSMTIGTVPRICSIISVC